MKYLPYFTMLLWVVGVTGYFLFPTFYLELAISIPVVVLLALLLPVSFWLLLERGKTILSLLMILLFISNNVLIGSSVFQRYRLYDHLRGTESGIDPGFMKLAVDDGSVETREGVARAIFRNYGVQVAFMNLEEQPVLYVPEEGDKNYYFETLDEKRMVSVQERQLAYDIMTLLFLIFLQLLIFVIVKTYLAISFHRHSLK